MLKKIWNKFKAFYNDTYGMLIVVSWAIFIICLIIKLFGGNWFELGTSNEKFNMFCEYVDTTKVLKKVIACLIYVITTIPVLLILLNEPKLKFKRFIIFVPLMIGKSIISWYNIAICYVFDVVIIIILPLALKKFKNWKRVIFGNVLIFVFQLISILVRNVSLDFNTGNTLVENYLYQIDYYIMIILFYLYYFKSKNKNKEIK